MPHYLQVSARPAAIEAEASLAAIPALVDSGRGAGAGPRAKASPASDTQNLEAPFQKNYIPVTIGGRCSSPGCRPQPPEAFETWPRAVVA